MKPGDALCPCTSGRDYVECCAPFHRGGEPSDAPTLVRARYSAFALGEIEFLWRTLHEDHPDKKRGRDKVLSAFRAASTSLRYRGMSILDHRPIDAGGEARVLYLARVFRKGQNISFVELADFLHDGVGLRYRSGKVIDASMPDPTNLTIELFAALAAAAQN